MSPTDEKCVKWGKSQCSPTIETCNRNWRMEVDLPSQLTWHEMWCTEGLNVANARHFCPYFFQNRMTDSVVLQAESFLVNVENKKVWSCQVSQISLLYTAHYVLKQTQSILGLPVASQTFLASSICQYMNYTWKTLNPFRSCLFLNSII